MLYYYKYNFVSPAAIYATIKEELSSYFESNALDDLMFPKWTNHCLKKLGKVTYSVKSTSLLIDSFEAKLPSDFYKIREVWACYPTDSIQYTNPSATYNQCIEAAIKVADTSEDPYCATDCNSYPDLIKVIYKFTDTRVIHYYRQSHLLKPGTIVTKNVCTTYSPNVGCKSPDEFDIHGNKIVTNFRQGNLYIVYHATSYDENGDQLVPDCVEIQDYIESYIKWKCFERLLNQATDETFNVLRYKTEKAEIAKNEKFIIARTETMKETVERKQLEKKRQLKANRIFELQDARPKRRYYKVRY